MLLNYVGMAGIEGQCAADLVTLINAAGQRAARREADAVRMEHFATLDQR